MGLAWLLFWGAFMNNGWKMSDKLWKLAIALGVVDILSDYLDNRKTVYKFVKLDGSEYKKN